MTPVVSIIICTRNRDRSLKETLDAIAAIEVPADLPTELLVVDNGSTDQTSEVIRDCVATNLSAHYLSEPNGGKSVGLNSALKIARGQILLFTDDDVRPPQNWIDGLCRPILEDKADAVQGGIRIADHLRRPWMSDGHSGLPASTEHWKANQTFHLVGANMSIARRVFDKIGGFDPAIGPGPAAGGEDTLLSYQMERAGFRILLRNEIAVVHHFDPDRLTRAAMHQAAAKGAVSDFFIDYHWLHKDISHPHLRLLRARCRLLIYRLRLWSQWRNHEAMPDWEKGMIQEIAVLRLYIARRGEPRAYHEPRACSRKGAEALPSRLAKS